MTDESALLAAAASNPWDSTPMLALADWYAERGQTCREAEAREGPPPVSAVFWSGDGDGDGYGDSYSNPQKALKGQHMPEVGGNWLIVLPHGWVICGHVKEQIAPFLFRVERAVVICRTNGVPWDVLAGGRQRDQPVYRNWGTVNIGPQFVLSRPWKGDLPKVPA